MKYNKSHTHVNETWSSHTLQTVLYIPSSFQPPSTWYAAVAVLQKKSSGKSAYNILVWPSSSTGPLGKPPNPLKPTWNPLSAMIWNKKWMTATHYLIKMLKNKRCSTDVLVGSSVYTYVQNNTSLLLATWSVHYHYVTIHAWSCTLKVQFKHTAMA